MRRHLFFSEELDRIRTLRTGGFRLDEIESAKRNDARRHILVGLKKYAHLLRIPVHHQKQ